ncbi:lipopolysaccharide biosynthesis protein [Sphingobium lignivorans]|uniref:O-antigen/teichoic acid export membrane protein n=1 Tax=Sphingobium lignivorans TaxID=2735886 RepID=A0ABR6NLW3_9SPHN|nr:lipopolysaccharide biosynthesis protein [Sphingobium lignivorans]MBB5987697.1 O-antigen/teichoic acid export membrane protein [Sphingobium lignivorans]
MTQDPTSRTAQNPAFQDAEATHDGFGDRVRSALFWRSGGQIVTQILSWTSTLAVIRILNPADYGLFAMTQVMLNFMMFLNGYGLISALVQSESVDTRKLRQAFGLMILMNGGLAAAQLLLAPLAASYYRQPMVADLLRAQALIYLSTPFISLPEVLMGRSLDFKRPAFVNLIAGLIAAGVAIGGALAGWGVWTLVWAPIAGFWSKAIGYLIATRFFVLPIFDFRGTGPLILYALSLLGSQLFFLIQSQADVFIGGRVLDPHALGLYAEALFLTQIFVSKFIPPLNDVAFPAFARMQADRQRVARSFRQAIRLLMLIACPLYLGMAVTAEPLVATLFGHKWLGMVPFVQVLALAMPFYALQVMFPPVCNAMGRPGLSARIAMIGAVIMPVAFLIGIRFGALGLAMAWLCAFPLFALVTARVAGRLIGLSFAEVGRAVAPGFISAAAMALIVLGTDSLLPGMAAPIRLLVLVAIGAGSFVALLALVSRETIDDLAALLLRRRPPTT